MDKKSQAKNAQSGIYGFGERLKRVRKDLRLTQPGMAEKLGTAITSYNRYEKEHRVPDIEFINKVVEVSGCDAAWLLSGKGGAEAPAPAVQHGYNSGLMREIIETIEEIFVKEKRGLPPAKKAELIDLLYEELSNEASDEEQRKGKILRFTRLAS